MTRGRPSSSTGRPPSEVALIAVDVGNSKTDLVLVAIDGSIVGAARGPSASHQAVGLGAGTRRLVELAAAAGGGRVDARLAVVCTAGADTPAFGRRLQRSYERAGLALRAIVRNDTEAVLRAGAPDGWGVALVCGAGVNCLGVGPDGRTARLLALGPITGDWGGGGDVGMAGLGAAVRGRDRRGPRTVLERSVPAYFGRRRPADVAMAIETGRLAERRLAELAPVVFETANGGDTVARAIVDRLADEQVTMAVAAIRRLGLLRTPLPVVLGGAIHRAADPAFHARIRDQLAERAPLARALALDAPPVLGAALLGLDVLGAGGAAGERLRSQLAATRFADLGATAGD